MTTMYGADVAELRSLAAQFDRTADQLDANRMAVGNAIQISAWVGPFAARFRLQWSSEHSLRIHSAAQLLRAGAQTLRSNADEQEGASVAESGTFVHGGLWKGASVVNRKGPRSAADFVRELGGMNKAEDGVRIEKILCDDGKCRYVVYIDGTASTRDGHFGGDLSLLDNVQAINSLDSSTLDNIRAKISAAIDDPQTEVALVGFSQGGLVAQRLADEGSFRTTTVLTYGSPVLQDARNYGGADVIRLEHNSDIIPGLGVQRIVTGPMMGALNLISGAEVPTAGEDVRFNAGTPVLNKGALSAHNQDDYAWVAGQFDNSSDRRYDVAKASLARFQGTVVADEK